MPSIVLVLASKVLNPRKSLRARKIRTGHLSGGDGGAGMSRRAFRNHIIQGIIFNKSGEVTQNAKEKPVVELDFEGRIAAVTIYWTPKVGQAQCFKYFIYIISIYPKTNS